LRDSERPDSQPEKGADSAMIVSWRTGAGEQQARLTAAFCIGPDTSGALQTDERRIDRTYVGVFLRDGRWSIRDLGCPGGLSINGTRSDGGPLPKRAVIALGAIHVMLEVDDSRATVQRGPLPPGEPIANRTVLHGRGALPPPLLSANARPPIRVRAGTEPAPHEFRDKVRIGRDAGCDIRIENDGVSRLHAEIFPFGNQWCVRDLGSSNGTYLDGQRIEEASLPARSTLRLGTSGPALELSYAAAEAARPDDGAAAGSIEEVAAHYFNLQSKGPAGHRTMMVRRAFQTVQSRQKRRYGSVIAAAVGLLLAAIAFGIYQHVQLQRTRGLAQQIFYSMKSIELRLARLEEQVHASGDAASRTEADRSREQLAEMATQYDALLEQLGILDDTLPPRDRLILRMARLFGECEVAMPKGFIDEVERYIEIWRKNPRFADGLRQAESQHLPSLIARIMLEQHMPPQFFYVALQESDFRPHAVGPETSFGIAKGIWQLMPQTASRYGLHTGPLLGLPKFDPDDERFDPAASTQAAARYLRDLYRGEAQASGLLVLASYNWGPTRVRKLIRAMKENPRDRNFWALLAQKDIPKETRDYVFLIFAAAVIGEDPKLFGFDFEKPLTDRSKAGP